MQPGGWARPSHVRAAWLHSVAPTPRCQTLPKLASHSTSRCCSPPEPQRRDVGDSSWSAVVCAHAAMLRTGVGAASGHGRCFQGAVRRHFDSLASRQRWPHGARACRDGRAICGGNRLRAALLQQRQPADQQRDCSVATRRPSTSSGRRAKPSKGSPQISGNMGLVKVVLEASEQHGGHFCGLQQRPALTYWLSDGPPCDSRLDTSALQPVAVELCSCGCVVVAHPA